MRVAFVVVVPESWMLGRLGRETRPYHQLADNDRLAMLAGDADRARYARFLSRIYGFESPVEATLLVTAGLENWLDLRDRGHLRLLRADLQALGIIDANALPRCSPLAPFRHPCEALGWVYVVERNTLLHAVIEQRLRIRLGDVLKVAGSYLTGPQRSNGQRIRDLGTAMDRMAKDPAIADRIVAAAKVAFRIQHTWYEVVAPPKRRVA